MSRSKNKKGITKKPLPIIIGIVLALLVFGAIILLAKPHNNALKNLYNNSAEIKAEYKLAGVAFVREAEDINGIKAIIGDEKTADFEPSITLTRWEDEVKFSVKPDISDVAKADRTLTLDKDKIVFNTPKIEYQMYDLPKTEGLEQGGYEFEIILKEKPASNVVGLDIETQNLDFFYQPPYTEEYKLGQKIMGKTLGSITETEVKDSDGKRFLYRPENVVGSYAVYYKDGKSGDYTALGGKNYKSGKAFHIYRPKIVDSAGKWIWGELNVDVQNKKLTVTILQEFLDNAVYPVHHAAGLTLGYTDVGPSDEVGSEGYTVGSKWTMPATGGIASKIQDASWGDGSIKMAIYKDADAPTLVANSSSGALVVPATKPTEDPQWENAAITASLEASTTYWLMKNDDSSLGQNHPYDSGDTNQAGYYSQAYAVFPPDTLDNKSGWSYVSWKFSNYVTYAEVSELKHTVKPTGQGGDFNTLDAAVDHLAASHANLVGANVYALIEIDGDWTGVSDTAAVQITGLVTDATHYVYVYTTAAARHAGVWNANKYNLLVSNSIALAIGGNDYVRIDGLQIGKSSSNADWQACIYTTSTINISNCILKQAGNASYNEVGILSQSSAANINIWNTVVYGLGAKASSNNVGITATGVNIINIYSSTFVSGYRGVFEDGAGTWTLKNVYAGGTAGADFGGTLTETNCASEDDTAGGTNHTHAPLDTDTFVNVSAGTENFHLAADGLSPLQAAEVDTSGDAAPLNFTTDIDGQTRLVPWDIGADEYEVPAAGGQTKINHGTIKLKHGTVKIK